MRRDILKLAFMFVFVFALLFITCACGSSRTSAPFPMTTISVSGQAFLAPGSPASIPATLRLKIRLLDSRLPLNAISIDPDGAGPQTFQAMNPILIGKDLPDSSFTSYYCDFMWQGPDASQAVLRADCGGGTFDAPVALFLAELAPWAD